MYDIYKGEVLKLFYFDKINGKTIMKSDLLDGVEHFFTTRESVIKSKEDDFQNLVEGNKKMFYEVLGISPENFINPSQTHSINVDIAQVCRRDYPECDGLILANTEQAIFLNFADCTPLILYDEKLNIGAVSHAGWRGTAGKIAQLTVQKMIEEFGSNSTDIKAVIGPTISMCCYNVGEDVLQKLISTVSTPDGVYEKRNGEFFVDLKEINRRQLNETGVERVDVCPYCTVCDNDLFFSYRKENATTNRHSAVLRLRLDKME